MWTGERLLTNKKSQKKGYSFKVARQWFIQLMVPKTSFEMVLILSGSSASIPFVT